MRGRLILAGQSWDELTLRELIDVTHAAIVEPQIHGAVMSLDAILREWDEILAMVLPDRDSFGLTPRAEAATAKAESTFGQARPLVGPRRRRKREKEPEVVSSGNPLDVGLVVMMQRAFQQQRASTLAPDDDHR